VVSLGNGQPIRRGFGQVSQTVVGEPIGAFWVRRTAGIFQSAADVQNWKNANGQVIQPGAQPGDLKFIDQNNDGQINDGDRTTAGSPIPKLITGLFLDSRYRAFDVGLNLRGNFGGKIFNVVKFQTSTAGDFRNLRGDLDPSTATRITSDPRLVAGQTGQGSNGDFASDRWIESGDFVRVQNLVFGYTLPEGVTQRLRFAGANRPRVYLNVQNLATFTPLLRLRPRGVGLRQPARARHRRRAHLPEPAHGLVRLRPALLSPGPAHTPPDPSMRFRFILRRTAAALLGAAGLGAAGCQNDVNVTDPNAPPAGTFGLTANEANASVTAAYAGLLQLGTFQRWQAFTYDLRSDNSTSRSPNPLIPALGAFNFPGGYDAEININTWVDSYRFVARTNTAIASMERATFDPALKARYQGEAKFLRGLGYFHLLTVFGGNIPLLTAPATTTDRPASSDSATVYAQIERDLSEAAAALPVQTTAQSGGRATKGAAQGPARQGAAAAAQVERRGRDARARRERADGRVRARGRLRPLFRQEGNQSAETLFEVQMGSPQTCVPGVGVCGLNIARMVGPCGIGFCDTEPTRWFFNEFFRERTTTGALDPRLDATIFYYKGDTTTLFNRTWRDRYGSDTTRIFWKKYSEYYLPGTLEQSWEAQINYKVVRYADVLLMYAEALNEQGQSAAAVPFVNRVRNRARLANYAGPVTVAAVRAEILRQRVLEFGLEMQRWLDIRRQNLDADLATLRSNDSDFNSYRPASRRCCRCRRARST
jgi:hypothetical protein